MRLAIVSDTHCPEFVDTLPQALIDGLQGADAILTAGDCGPVDALARIAPVHAVRGDHDPAGLNLPAELRLELGGVRIGLCHGNRSRLIEEPLTFLLTIGLGYLTLQPGLRSNLKRRFPDADLIVFGHTHQRHWDGRLLNPGAVYQVSAQAARDRLRRHPGWFEWCWLQVMRFRRRTPKPSFAIVEIEGGKVSPPRFIDL